MSRRTVTPLLLILALLFGAWTVAVHDADHAGTAAHAESCAVCAFAGGLGGALPSAGYVLFLLALASTPWRAPTATPRAAHREPARARGPPLILT